MKLNTGKMFSAYPRGGKLQSWEKGPCLRKLLGSSHCGCRETEWLRTSNNADALRVLGGRAFGSSSAVWFWPGVPGEVAVRGYGCGSGHLKGLSTYTHMRPGQETLKQLGAGTGGDPWTPLSIPMYSVHVLSLARWHQGHQVSSVLAQVSEGVCPKRTWWKLVYLG